MKFEARARSALEYTADAIRRFGPRLTGSESCREAARDLVSRAHSCSDNAIIEEFEVHPRAFLGFIRVLVVMYAIAAPLLAFLPILSAVMATAGIFILVFGFFLYRKVLDPFFPREKGYNVVATLEPEGEVRRQVIVSGHHDSARVFNFYIDQPEKYSRRVYGGIGSVVALWLVSMGLTAASLAMGRALPGIDATRLAAAGIFLALLPRVLPLWKFASDEGTPGAGDNLVASAVAMEVLSEFAARRMAGKGLAHTRLVFASFDAEEAGLRGARAFAEARRSEFSALPTYGFNMDCVYSLEDLTALTSDLNGSVKLDAEATRLVAETAAIEELSMRTAPIAFLTGGTDAAELARAGVKSSSLVAMRWGNDIRSSAYHTPGDTVDAVDPAAVEALIRLGVGFIGRLDSL